MVKDIHIEWSAPHNKVILVEEFETKNTAGNIWSLKAIFLSSSQSWLESVLFWQGFNQPIEVLAVLEQYFFSINDRWGQVVREA